MFYTLSKAARLFSYPDSSPLSASDLQEMSDRHELPPLKKGRGGLGWSPETVAGVGQEIGFLKHPAKPLFLSVFVTKGGVLKTTVSLNIARLLALHGIKTLVIGLDLQGDITSALGYQPAEGADDLDEAMAALDGTRGLYDYFKEKAGLTELILKSDLPHLDFIPETSELIALDQELFLRPRREHWLKEKVITPLTQKYEAIILDSSPNWNQLTTSSLVAADMLVSPVECRINNFRNLRLFRALLKQCQSDLDLDFQHMYVPTRLNTQRKLSREIFQWYQENLPGCSEVAVRESIHGEEGSALHRSIPELAPDAQAAEEMKALVRAIWNLALSRRREVRRLKTEVNPWP